MGVLMTDSQSYPVTPEVRRAADYLFDETTKLDAPITMTACLALAQHIVALQSATPERNNRFCKHDDCPYPDCLIEGGICPLSSTQSNVP